MRAVVVFVACLAVVTAVPTNPQRIVGGNNTTVEDYPFAAALLWSSSGTFFSQYCGGSIISSRYILTAAHCVVNDSPYQWRSRVGSTSKSSGGLVYETLSLKTHPDYNSRIIDNDVALIQTTAPIAVNGYNIAAASIAGPTYVPADNDSVWAIGWGAISSGGSSPDTLRHVQVWVINQQTCRQRYAEVGNTVTDNMICSGWLDVGGRDQCQGDSGGPLVYNGVVVGVCSWGRQCALAYYPGVNARVSRFTTWITSNAI